MTTQPDSPAWSGAVQRELDGLQRNVDTRLAEFTTRLDKLLTLTEYHADMRAIEIRLGNSNEKIQDAERDIDILKREVRDAYESLRREMATQRQQQEVALAAEARNRQDDHKEYVKSRQSQFRWLISMVMIPIAVVIVQLAMSKK